jgi:hypothetical protein
MCITRAATRASRPCATHRRGAEDVDGDGRDAEVGGHFPHDLCGRQFLDREEGLGGRLRELRSLLRQGGSEGDGAMMAAKTARLTRVARRS